jgi:hypothetical protein
MIATTVETVRTASAPIATAEHLTKHAVDDVAGLYSGQPCAGAVRTPG